MGGKKKKSAAVTAIVAALAAAGDGGSATTGPQAAEQPPPHTVQLKGVAKRNKDEEYLFSEKQGRNSTDSTSTAAITDASKGDSPSLHAPTPSQLFQNTTSKRYMTRQKLPSMQASLTSPSSLRFPIRSVNGSCLSSAPATPGIDSVETSNQLTEAKGTLNSPLPNETDQAQELKSPTTSSVLYNSVEKQAHSPVAEQKSTAEKDGGASCTSDFEFTTFANGMNKDDSEEISSGLDPCLVTVNGYKVKGEVAPLLRSIISKYGDIGKNCCAESPEIRSTLLNEVCVIVQRLEKKGLKTITTSEIVSLTRKVSDLQNFKLEVGWLKERLQSISEAKETVKGYADMKEKKRRILEGVEMNEKSLKMLKERSSQVEKELADIIARKRKELEDLQYDIMFHEEKSSDMHAEIWNVDDDIADAKDKMRTFGKSLVRGLVPSMGWIDDA